MSKHDTDIYIKNWTDNIVQVETYGSYGAETCSILAAICKRSHCVSHLGRAAASCENSTSGPPTCSTPERRYRYTCQGLPQDLGYVISARSGLYFWLGCRTFRTNSDELDRFASLGRIKGHTIRACIAGKNEQFVSPQHHFLLTRSTTYTVAV